MKRPSILRQRVPAKKDVWALFLVCLFLTHVRAYLVFFYSLPSFLLHMTYLGVLGVLSYALMYAVLDSVFFLVTLLTINFLLPERLFKQKFLPQGILTTFLIVLWMMPVNWRTLMVIIPASAILIYLFWSIRRQEKHERIVLDIGERVQVLSSLFLVVDFLALCIVLIRYI